MHRCCCSCCCFCTLCFGVWVMTMSNRTVHTQLGKPLTSLTLYAMVMQLSGRVVHYRFLALYAKAAAAITLGVPGSDDLALQFGQFLATQYWNLVGAQH